MYKRQSLNRLYILFPNIVVWYVEKEQRVFKPVSYTHLCRDKILLEVTALIDKITDDMEINDDK